MVERRCSVRVLAAFNEQVGDFRCVMLAVSGVLVDIVAVVVVDAFEFVGGRNGQPTNAWLAALVRCSPIHREQKKAPSVPGL